MTLGLLNQIKDIKRGQSMEGVIICAEISLARVIAIVSRGTTSFTTIH